MASFARFGESRFDPADWVNGAFAGEQAKANPERHAQALIAKLQLVMAEMERSVDGTREQIVSALPRMCREIESMQRECGLLRGQMHTAHGDVQRVEQHTVAVMEELLTLDERKCELKKRQTELKQMDNWAMLTGDLDEVFRAGDADAMAERIVALQNCLQSLGEHVDDYESRSDYLSRLKDQFVAAISPSVVGAFSSQTHDNVLYFGRMFADIGRTHELEQYYSRWLKTNLDSKWEALVTDANLDPVELLAAWHDILLAEFLSQLKWTGPVLGGAAAACRCLCAAMRQSTDALGDGVRAALAERLAAVEDAPAALGGCRMACDRLVKSVLAAGASTGDDDSELQSWLDSIYGSLLDAAVDYSKYVRGDLAVRLNAVKVLPVSDGETAPGDVVRAFDESIGVVFTNAYKTVTHATNFMGKLSVAFLINPLHSYLCDYLSKARQAITSLAGFGAATGESAGRFSSENWELVDGALKMTAVCGRLHSEVEKLEAHLATLATQLHHEITSGSTIEHRRRLSSTSGESPCTVRFESMLRADARVSPQLAELGAEFGGAGGQLQLLSDVARLAGKVGARANKLCLEVIVGPPVALLQPLPKWEVWCSATLGSSLAESLPRYAVAPQEYVTKMGHYLVSVTQHLEPYFASAAGDDNYLAVQLTKHRLPFVSDDPDYKEPETCEQAARQWLAAVAGALSSRYVETCLRVRALSAAGAKQLVADLDYWISALDDLSTHCPSDVRSLRALANAGTELTDVNVGAHPATMVAAVRQMRAAAAKLAEKAGRNA